MMFNLSLRGTSLTQYWCVPGRTGLKNLKFSLSESRPCHTVFKKARENTLCSTSVPAILRTREDRTSAMADTEHDDGGDDGNEDVEAEAQVEFKPLIEVRIQRYFLLLCVISVNLSQKIHARCEIHNCLFFAAAARGGDQVWGGG
jgi:hypothetical protein